MHLLYPSNPLRAGCADDTYAEELECLLSKGFEHSVFSLEAFQEGAFKAIPALPRTTKVLYRGWMLSATEYGSLATAVNQSGSRLMTDLETYLSNHHLPNWYPKISSLTPETHIFSSDANLAEDLAALQWPEYFLKDYVKSLKTSIGSRITKPEQATQVTLEMRHYRGTIEGGICVRRVEPFLPDTEKRYFVVRGTPEAAFGEAPAIVQQAAKRLIGQFYSVDVARRADGELRIVEVGDGQVSDLVGWTSEQFAGMLSKHFLSEVD